MTAGVVILGHGDTASRLLAAAIDIVGEGGLADVAAIDAGLGETPGLGDRVCDAIDAAEQGSGVLLLVDLVGASPCACAQRQASDRRMVTLAGLNLAMLLKVASVDRTTLSAAELADKVAKSGRRAVALADPANTEQP